MKQKIMKKAEQLMQTSKLKTLDLIILAYAVEYKVDKLYSFDKKLRKAHYQFKLCWLQKS